MKKTFTCFILLYLILGIGNTKSQCLDEITICQNGISIIPFESIDDSVLVSFFSYYGNSYIDVPLAVIDSQIIIQPIFTNINSGNYIITVDSSDVCFGTFISNICKDQISINNSSNCYSNIENSCDPDLFYVREIGYCLGDTTILNIIPYDTASVFAPDRLVLTNAEVISYTKNSFTVVWKSTGKGCLEYMTSTIYGDTTYSYYNVNVFSKEATTILVDGISMDSIEICQGDSLHLSVLGFENESFFWIKNGYTTYTQVFYTSFTESGVYEVTAKFPNYCICTPISKLIVKVTKSDYPNIKCARTVCLGETVTYTSSSICDDFIWNVSSGGSIVDGGGKSDNFISVLWTSGLEGAVGLNTPNCFQSECVKPKIAPVSIINPNGSIQGLEKICSGNTTTYTAPYFTGTSYEWVVTGNGIISSGQGSSSVTVSWLTEQKTIEKISVKYINCNIDCEGYAEKDVTISPLLLMEYQSNNLCIDKEFSFSNNLNIPVRWRVENLYDSILYEYYGTELNYVFEEAGNVIVKIHDLDSITCNITAKVYFNIQTALTAPTRILGNKVICLNSPYQYATNLSLNEVAEWKIYDGDTLNPVLTIIERDIVYNWISGGPYLIEVKKINTITGCESPTFQQPIVLQNSILGATEVCISKNSYYSLAESNGETIEWSIEPLNAGNITGPSNGSYIYIQWKYSGLHTIKTSYCGNEVTLKVYVSPIPKIKYDYDKLVCYGELSEVSVNALSNETWEIKKLNNTISATNPTFLPKGYYNIVLQNKSCSISSNFTIEETPAYDLKLRVISASSLCQPSGSAYVLLTKDIDASQYEWFKDGLPFGEDKPILTIFDFGSYYLKITDKNGCTAVSDVLIVDMCCDPVLSEGGGSSQLTISTTHIDCATKLFNINPPFESTYFNWIIYKKGMLVSLTGTDSLLYTFESAGEYTVLAYGNESCDTIITNFCGLESNFIRCEEADTTIEIKLIPNFYNLSACSNKIVQFENTSTTTLPSYAISYLWNFGDTLASAANNTSTQIYPQHLYKEAGTYIVTLVMSDNNGCELSISRSIKVSKTPEFSIESVDVVCFGQHTWFQVNPKENNTFYEWDFDDSSSSIDVSYNSTVYYKFLKRGMHYIKLTGSNSQGCKSTVYKWINVIEDNIDGEITSNIPLPKCPEDSVTLSATEGNYTYLWDNGMTTRQITINQAGTYRVTISNTNGCEYIPLPFVVNNHSIINSNITAKRYFSNGAYQLYYDSLTVCIGDSFDLIATSIPNASYHWSNGYKDKSILKFEEHFKDLPPGRYIINLNIETVNGECAFDLKPFIINILESPQIPFIVGNSESNCDSERITLHIDSPIDNVDYLWSTGYKTDTILLSYAGKFFVTAKNTNGCIARSELYTIYPSPRTNEWLSGCIEVCLPKEFCINFNPINIYELLKNDVLIDTIVANSEFLDLSEPGNYKVNITNQYGCKSLSDPLELEAKPNIHAVQGIVFFDANKNNIFDLNKDTLLEGVKVEAIKDGVVYHSMFTNSVGAYRFDSLRHKNMVIQIDYTGIGYSLEGTTKVEPSFDRCVENKEINFPLISDCKTRSLYRFAYACYGSYVEFDGVSYPANTKDTLIIPVNKNCDSLVFINVSQRERPNLDLYTSYDCDSIQGGKLIINNKKDQLLNYSIDDGPPSLDTLFLGIASGDHTLKVRNAYGCTEEFNFAIELLNTPATEIITQNSCKDLNEGAATIQNLSGSNIEFSLNNIDRFSSETLFDSLSVGHHVVFIRDSKGCIHQNGFEILAHEMPTIPYEIMNTCKYDTSGTLLLSDIQNVSTYLDNALVFDSTLLYKNLEQGQHVLHFKTQEGCIDSLVFVIEVLPEPITNVAIQNTCKNQNLGIVTIHYKMEDSLLFRINKLDEFKELTNFSFLPRGMYILEMLDKNGCTFTEEIVIDTFISPKINIQAQNSCEDQENGSLYVISDDSISFSLSNSPETYNLADTIKYLNKGIYQLFTIDVHGCKDTLLSEILENPIPSITFDVEAECENNNLGTVKIIGDSIIQYSFDGNSFTQGTETINLATGEYSIYLKDNEGCIYEKRVEIPFLSAPAVDFVLKSSCKNVDNGTITILNSDSSFVYSMDSLTFVEKSLFDNLPNGSHMVYIQNEIGCIYNYKINIDTLPIAEAVLISTYSCPNDRSGSINIITDSVNLISFEASPFSNQYTFDGLSEGNYSIEVQDTFGCVEKFSKSVIELPELQVLFPPLELDCFTDNIILQPIIEYTNGPAQFTWSNGSTGSSIEVDKAGNFAIEVSDSCQEVHFEWDVNIQKVEDNKILHAPNVFTPFRGNANSCFKVIPPANSGILDFTLTVFDRWGNLVFISKDYQECWDGTLKGQKVEQGVYVYIAEIMLMQCDIPKKEKIVGDVTVLY